MLPSFLVVHQDTSQDVAEWYQVETVATSSRSKFTITINDVPQHPLLEDSYKSCTSQLDPHLGWYHECKSGSWHAQWSMWRVPGTSQFAWCWESWIVVKSLIVCQEDFLPWGMSAMQSDWMIDEVWSNQLTAHKSWNLETLKHQNLGIHTLVDQGRVLWVGANHLASFVLNSSHWLRRYCQRNIGMFLFTNFSCQ